MINRCSWSSWSKFLTQDSWSTVWPWLLDQPYGNKMVDQLFCTDHFTGQLINCLVRVANQSSYIRGQLINCLVTCNWIRHIVMRHMINCNATDQSTTV
jgi:hypothetical protein